MDHFNIEDIIIATEISEVEGAQPRSLGKNEFKLTQNLLNSDFLENPANSGTYLDMYTSIELQNAGIISPEMSQKTAQYCPYEGENMYNFHQNMEDQKPFVNQHHEKVEDSTFKMIKKSDDSEARIPYTRAEDECQPTAGKKSTKQKKATAKAQTNIVVGGGSQMDLDCQDLKYDQDTDFQNDYITVVTNVMNLPDALKQIEPNEAKNFPKSMGDCFFDYLYKKYSHFQTLLKKDCLSSLNIWNALFNPAERAQHEKKSQLSKLMKGLNTLSDEFNISGEQWFEFYMNFLSTFDPRTFRTQENIEKPERRLLYEMLARVMIEGLKEIQDILSRQKDLRVVSFKLQRVHKEKGVFLIKTNSPNFDQQFAKDSKGKTSRRSKKAKVTAQKEPQVANFDLFEIEREGEAPVAFDSLQNNIIADLPLFNVPQYYPVQEHETPSLFEEPRDTLYEEIPLAEVNPVALFTQELLQEGNTMRGDVMEEIDHFPEATSFIAYNQSEMEFGILQDL